MRLTLPWNWMFRATHSGIVQTQGYNKFSQGVVTYMSCVEMFAKLNQAGRSRDQGAATINISRTRGCNLTFDPENQAIKSLRREQSSDQAHILPIKHFDCGRRCFNR